MQIKTITGIATACLIVIGGFGCAQNRTDTAMSRSTPAAAPAMAPMDDSATRSSTSAMGPTGTGGASTPYTAPATTSTATGSSTSMTTTDAAPADMPAPQSDRN